MRKNILLLSVLIGLFISCKNESTLEGSYKGKSLEANPIQTSLSEKLEKGEIVVGQIIYVPAYSHIYFRDKENSINLAVTLSIRNTDITNPITVNSVRYYDSEGKLIRHYLEQPLQLAPMASKEYIVEEDDTTGGVGANFIVEWDAKTPVSEPVVEAVMITARSSQGISFVSAGRVIKNFSKEDKK